MRARLVEALRLDLVGPGPADESLGGNLGGDLAEEALPGWIRPSTWYVTGFLIPSGTPPERAADADEDEELDQVQQSAGEPGESSEDRRAAKKGFFPSSMGLSFLVAAAETTIEVIVTWGDYVREDVQDADGGRVPVWRRTPRSAAVPVRLLGPGGPAARDVPGSGGLQLVIDERPVALDALASYIPAGARSVSVFLVNNRPADDESPDRAYAFQAELRVRGSLPFVPRPDLQGSGADEWDDLVADLHYADAPEFATGHGVSAGWEVAGEECRVVWTTWLPVAEVAKTATSDVEGVELSMEILGALEPGGAKAALQPLTDRYRTWIAAQRVGAGRLQGRRRETAEELLALAEVAARRIETGIGMLDSDDDVLDAFRMANRSVARALRRRLHVERPSWRVFQLAFLLLNLPGLADPGDPERDIVDLLFFPTGGGKTEAYLGLAAFAMVLRRLRRRSGGEGAETALGGAGVSVIMRYTLRLLTLDQLGRAAGLVCALELERCGHEDRYGSWPFEIGLWVGRGAAPNRLGARGDDRQDTARSLVLRYRRNPRGRPAPLPIEACPWCQAALVPESFVLVPDEDRPTQLVIACANRSCEFSGKPALPIVAVDEAIYRRLPAFLIATVDKFAALPRVGACGVLLGGADRHDAAGFYGASEPGPGFPLPAPLPPPELIIQDELHLISGPLGTMAGLYETAIEALCSPPGEGRRRPKIIASTATVRRAQDQIQALFGRPLTQVFPPPGPDRSDSFFARVVPATTSPARLYLGIASQGRNPKALLRRVWLALLGAAERAYGEAGGAANAANPADPYMTVLGYFNSLQELGGARRVIEEQIQNTVKSYGARRRIGQPDGLFRDRRLFSSVVELTSRVTTANVATARERLGRLYHERGRVDCAIATNMISVGLDIPRLGLMVVHGQ
ncbi:MAG TPA: helicase, partial [Actinomycetota bacterium]